MDIKNKTVVITGGSSGLGRALAEGLKSAGAHVLICSNNQKELREVVVEAEVDGLLCDITDPVQVQNFAKSAHSKLKEVDIWINNAGIGNHHTKIELQDPAFVHKMMEVNFFGMMYGSQEALKIMKKQKQGTIINILSIRAMKAHPLSAGYSATKWAARGFAEALRVAGEESGVSVINIYPTGMKTEFYNINKPDDYGRFMEPKEVARRIIENLELSNPEDDLIVEKNSLYS